MACRNCKYYEQAKIEEPCAACILSSTEHFNQIKEITVHDLVKELQTLPNQNSLIKMDKTVGEIVAKRKF